MPSGHQAVTIHECTMCADALPPLLLLLVSRSDVPARAAGGVVYGMLDHKSTPFSIGLGISFGLALVFAIILHATCPQYNVPKYKVPLFPYLPTASLALNAVLMASLSWQAYMQLAVFFGVMIFAYLVYGVHAATYYEQRKVPRKDTEAQKATVPLDELVDRSPSSVVRLTRASGAIKYLPPPVED